MPVVSSSAPAVQMAPAPAVLGNMSTNVHHHSDTANATHMRRRQHNHLQGSSPSEPEALLPPNRTAGTTSPTLSVVAAGPAPTQTTQSPSSSSGQNQRLITTCGRSRLNYTANPEVWSDYDISLPLRQVVLVSLVDKITYSYTYMDTDVLDNAWDYA
ncbi:hypothetical protein M758_10G056100 [Ceratodon purpureus]|nr:hypothetical protein M758_10G056100 [Ceratodon purpureus]